MPRSGDFSFGCVIIGVPERSGSNVGCLGVDRSVPPCQVSSHVSAVPSAAARQPRAVAPLPSPQELDAAVRTAWAEVFGGAALGRRCSAPEDFFAAGGDSLAATRLVARLRRSLGCPLTVR